MIPTVLSFNTFSEPPMYSHLTTGFLPFEFHLFDSNNDLPVQLPVRFEYSLCGSAYSGFGRFAGGSAGGLSTLDARLRFEIRIDCQGRVCGAGIVTIMRISGDGKLGL